MGDPNGIGPELILKALEELKDRKDRRIVLYGSKNVLEHYRDLLQLQPPAVQAIDEVEELEEGNAGIIETWNGAFGPEPGNASKEAGNFAYQALYRASSDLREGKLDALVTAPLNKWTVRTEERPFPGHTEFLTSFFGVDGTLMLMMSGGLRVGLVTGHIPLQKVVKDLSKDLILGKTRILERSLRFDLGIERPRIAVLGLNPHAGESGMLGDEEERSIGPAIEQGRRAEGMELSGPFPADGLFGSDALREYDAVLAMYHDQGLGPFKALSFGRGVNFTAGLPIVRTSPDHGTAYGIAGKGIASSTSFLEAIEKGSQLFKTRLASGMADPPPFSP
jgi:4-hydroxythreonine-4-phosphate dehydrogenase